MKKTIKITSVIFIALFFMFSNININAITEKKDLNLTQEEILENLNNSEMQVKVKKESELNLATIKSQTNITRTENSAYKLARNNGVDWAFWFDAFDSRGLPAYCIEPGAYMNAGLYNAFDPSNLTNEQKNRIRLILYHGAPNIGNSLLDRFATQILISETITGSDYKIYNSSNGSVVDTSLQESIINNNISRHHLLPSFAGDTRYAKRNETIWIGDNTGVLNDFSLGSLPPGAIVNKTGNDLYLNFSSPGNYTITLNKNPLYGHQTSQAYWNSPNSQNVVSGAEYDPVATTFNVNVSEIFGDITVEKFEPVKNIPVEGAVFELLKKNSVGEYEPYYDAEIRTDHKDSVDLQFDESGKVLIKQISEDKLIDIAMPYQLHYYTTKDGILNLRHIRYGEYALREIYAPFGHVLSEKLIEFKIDINGKQITKEFANRELTSNVALSKTDSNTNELVDGAVFELLKYNFETQKYEPYINEFVTNSPISNGLTKLLPRPLDLEIKDDKVITKKIQNHEMIEELNVMKKNYYVSKNGIVFLNSVPYGRYALKEVYSPTGYLVNDMLIPFDVTENGTNIELAFPNEEITSTINFKKVDSSTKVIIPGAEIVMDKYNYKSEKWEHFISFTSKNVETILNNVSYGTYRISELKAPTKYNLTSKNIIFDVTEDGAEIILELPNSKLPVTGMVDISIILIAISGGLVLLRKLVK